MEDRFYVIMIKDYFPFDILSRAATIGRLIN